ncbi:MAG: hypothetical protein GY832_30095 [Chloroflexi bacterium]|nr:hypothetical protein [Chloroflexota bacterium]
MISLKQETEPFDIELPYGVVVSVRPLKTTDMAAIQATARQRLEAIDAQVRERMEAGLGLGDLPDLADADEREGFLQCQIIYEMASRQIISWSGIEDDPPPSRDNIIAVMDIYPVGEHFLQKLTFRQMMLNAAKNASGPSASGTSSQAEGPDTAKGAGKKARPARKAKRARTASAART